MPPGQEPPREPGNGIESPRGDEKIPQPAIPPTSTQTSDPRRDTEAPYHSPFQAPRWPRGGGVYQDPCGVAKDTALVPRQTPRICSIAFDGPARISEGFSKHIQGV